MRLSTQQVRYFLAAIREGNFTRAARSCGVRQPTLSQCLKDLESTVGGALFERTAHRVQLTPLGRAIRPHLSGVARSAAKADETARAFRLKTNTAPAPGHRALATATPDWPDEDESAMRPGRTTADAGVWLSGS